MKSSFFWKFLICLIPVLWSSWMVGRAWTRYAGGEPGGFKLGVDLVGGTILVYEIDLRKVVQDKAADGDAGSEGDPTKSTSQKEAEDSRLLAEALKKRIDPNDLYNIIIRPASGGRNRVDRCQH